MASIGAAVAAIATWAGASAGTAAAIGTAVNIAVAAASVAVSVKTARDQKKQAERAQMESNQRNAYRNFRQALTPRRIVYGRARVAGPILFATNRDQFEAHLLIGIASHEIDAFEAFYVLKDELPVLLDTESDFYGQITGPYAGNVILWPFKGTAAQNIGAKMRTAQDVRQSALYDISLGSIIEETDRWAGIAALYVVTLEFGMSWEGQSPEFGALIRGKKILDPRTGLTAWSNNPALCARDYLVNIMAFPPSSIDEAALIAAANICDQLVPLKAGGTEKRYECNGVIGAEVSHDENLRTLARSMAGAIRYSSGKWIIEAGAPKTTAAAFDESMVLAPYAIAFEKPDRSLPNAVRGNFIDATEWQPTSYPGYRNEAAIATEGQENHLEIDLPLTTSHTMAQRIARIELGRARARQTLSLDFDLRAYTVRPGDVITYTAPDLGIDAAPYEIDAFSLSRVDNPTGTHLGVRLDLTAYDSSIFAWTPATDEIDLVRGTVVLDSIRPKFFDNLEVDERNLITTPNFSADYVFTADNPASAFKVLNLIEFRLTVEITTNDGTTDHIHTVNVTDSVTVLGLIPTKGYTVDVAFTIPGGHTYVSHTLETAEVRGNYDDSTTSPWQSATLIPGL